MAGYYDKKKDYSKELQRSDLTDQERSQLQQERQNKIDAVYGGVEPNMAGKSYTYSQSQKGGSSSGGGSQYAGTNYHREAIDAAREYAKRRGEGRLGRRAGRPGPAG